LKRSISFESNLEGLYAKKMQMNFTQPLDQRTTQFENSTAGPDIKIIV
jgi:hypothetical protein